MTGIELASKIYHAKFHFSDEKSLQQGIGIALTEWALEFEPEVSLTPRDRIDFLVVDGIGVEVKSEGVTLAAVTRQLHRYAQSDRVKELIFVTTKSKHRDLPETMNDKPLHVVYLIQSFF
jgi:hypothetical protein